GDQLRHREIQRADCGKLRQLRILHLLRRRLAVLPFLREPPELIEIRRVLVDTRPGDTHQRKKLPPKRHRFHPALVRLLPELRHRAKEYACFAGRWLVVWRKCPASSCKNQRAVANWPFAGME